MPFTMADYYEHMRKYSNYKYEEPSHELQTYYCTKWDNLYKCELTYYKSLAMWQVFNKYGIPLEIKTKISKMIINEYKELSNDIDNDIVMKSYYKKYIAQESDSEDEYTRNYYDSDSFNDYF